MKEIVFNGKSFDSIKKFSEFLGIPASTIRRWNYFGWLSSPERLSKCMKEYRTHRIGRRKRPPVIQKQDKRMKTKSFNVWNDNESFSSVDYSTLCELVGLPENEILDAIDFGIKCNGFFIDEAF